MISLNSRAWLTNEIIRKKIIVSLMEEKLFQTRYQLLGLQHIEKILYNSWGAADAFAQQP